FVVNLRLRAQFGGFLFGRGVTQEVAAADLGACQVFQQVRATQRRMKLDMEMEPAVIAAISRRLMQRHDVRERHSPQVVELHQQAFERVGEVAHFRIVELRNARMRSFRRDESLIGVAREVRQESDRRFILIDDTPPVIALGLEDVLKKNPPGLGQVPLGDALFGLDGFEDEVGRVNLTMRVRVGDADHFAFVLEDQHMIDLFVRAKLDVLLLPNAHQVGDLAGLEFGQRRVVARAVADDSRYACRGTVAVNPLWACDMARRVETNARMVVIEDERARVIVIALAADARIAGTEVAIGQIVRQRRFFMLDCFAAPRAVLSVRGDNDPFLAQGMPSFFPDHKLQSKDVVANYMYNDLSVRRVSPLASYMNAPGGGSGAFAHPHSRSARPSAPSSRRNRSPL